MSSSFRVSSSVHIIRKLSQTFQEESWRESCCISCLAVVFHHYPHDRGKGVPSFDEMVAIVLEEVDFDDPTTNVHDVAP